MDKQKIDNEIRKALSFTIWETGDESSMSNTKRLSEVISAYQQHLADEEGDSISWGVAIERFFAQEIRQNFEQLLAEAKDDCEALNFDTVLPQA